ncbi:MAG: hypothetical protein AB3N64_05125 [Puniceicoccaceae bacterium]
MPSDAKESNPSRNRFMEWLCECLPNCDNAMELVETGIERDLTAIEKVRLKYNSRLCPFCACATGKFESAKARMEEAQVKRRSV